MNKSNQKLHKIFKFLVLNFVFWLCLSFELEFCNGKMTTNYVVRDAYLELFDLLNFRRHFQQQTIPPIRQAIFH